LPFFRNWRFPVAWGMVCALHSSRFFCVFSIFPPPPGFVLFLLMRSSCGRPPAPPPFFFSHFCLSPPVNCPAPFTLVTQPCPRPPVFGCCFSLPVCLDEYHLVDSIGREDPDRVAGPKFFLTRTGMESRLFCCSLWGPV